MTNQLQTIEAFIQLNQAEPHLHIVPIEARAFYTASVEGTIGPRSLDGQKIILGCLVCSAVLAEIQPGATPVGRHVVSR
jgi:hypothetical protein